MNEVRFTQADVERLRKALSAARASGKSTFKYKPDRHLTEVELDVGYAKYLLQFLEDRFRRP